MTPTPTPLTWRDTNGRPWSCAITLGAAKRLKDTQSIDLLDPNCVDILFGSDPITRIEAIGELLREQWTAADCTYEQFAELLISGDTTFDDATEALKAGLSDFFRRIGRRDLAAVIDRAWDAMTADAELRLSKANGPKVAQIFERTLAESARQIDAELDAALGKMHASTPTPGPQSGSSPGSPASIGHG